MRLKYLIFTGTIFTLTGSTVSLAQQPEKLEGYYCLKLTQVCSWGSNNCTTATMYEAGFGNEKPPADDNQATKLMWDPAGKYLCYYLCTSWKKAQVITEDRLSSVEAANNDIALKLRKDAAFETLKADVVQEITERLRAELRQSGVAIGGLR